MYADGTSGDQRNPPRYQKHVRKGSKQPISWRLASIRAARDRNAKQTVAELRALISPRRLSPTSFARETNRRLDDIKKAIRN